MIKKLALLLVLLTAAGFAQLMNPKIMVWEDEYDFGDIIQGDKVSHTFIINNNGGDLLKIENVRASCGCTAAILGKEEIAPGKSTELKVTFNSDRRNGKQIKKVYITSNDPERPEIILTIKANVVNPNSGTADVPILYFPETQHNFGKVKEGEIVKHTFKFINKGNTALKIRDIKTSCGCTAALVSSEMLEPGEEGTLNVELDTKNRSGKMSRTITITSNDPKDPVKVLTVYANVIREE